MHLKDLQEFVCKTWLLNQTPSVSALVLCCCSDNSLQQFASVGIFLATSVPRDFHWPSVWPCDFELHWFSNAHLALHRNYSCRVWLKCVH